MHTITVTELKKHFDKYNELAKKEEIIVTSHGKPIYFLKPIKAKINDDAMSLVGMLPKNATIGVDPDERG
ncbi:MAG: type II toxin-antitoxin system prevent-host-death family antitoxin [Bacilli bacterium]|nr:type II toxin-antitoxin system prevent-host-death family antitoxin [Bacilli bacterium]